MVLCSWPLAASGQDGAGPEWLAELSGEPEIPGLRIQWTANDGLATYTSGVDRKQAVALFFYADNCEFCDRMLQRFSCPTLARYAGQVTFGFTTRGSDDGGDGLANALDVQRYPTMVLLMPDPNLLHVIGRVVGDFDVDTIAEVIDQARNSEEFQDQFGKPEALASAAETAAKMANEGVVPIEPELCGSASNQ